ncbi:hypothetical protein [Arthrobacter sp. ISL-30]|nr:hypothetical protein [Arthrobacter sp. ISL-30]
MANATLTGSTAHEVLDLGIADGGNAARTEQASVLRLKFGS